MTASSSPVIVARAGTYYRVTRYIVVAAVIVVAILFIKDGFWTYPREQAERKEDIDHGRPPRSKEHTEADIRLQKILGIGLPPLGLAFLAWTLWRSRGAYRLEGNTLNVPGHRPIPLDQITAIDRRLWDRKGVAYVHYPLPGGGEGRAALDDFIYQRDPTDAIFDKVEAAVKGTLDSPTSPA